MPSDRDGREGDGFCAVAFGLRWHSDVTLAPYFADDASPGPVDVRVHRVEQLPERGRGERVRRGWVFADGVRFVAGDTATFDMIRGDRIAYCPGREWPDALPAAFFGTVTALTLAWRGVLPFHASAVELGGRTILIAGPSGAGKSSLAAGLNALGARFVADDLSAVDMQGGACRVFPGRTTMRLHADTASSVDSAERYAVQGDPRGKWLVRPAARTQAESLPLAGMLLLGGPAGIAPPHARFPPLHAQLFRPHWLAALPNHRARLTTLLGRAADIPVIGFPAIAAYDAQDQRARARDALARIEAFFS